MSPEKQARQMGQAWEKLSSEEQEKRQVCFKVIEPDGQEHDFYLGAHAPKLTDEEINLIHKLWLNVTQEAGVEELHHNEIVKIALGRLEQELSGKTRRELLDEMRTITRQQGPSQQATDEEQVVNRSG